MLYAIIQLSVFSSASYFSVIFIFPTDVTGIQNNLSELLFFILDDSQNTIILFQVV